jgi:hypothetical protein
MNMDSDSTAKAADEPDWLMDEPLEHAGTASEAASAVAVARADRRR